MSNDLSNAFGYGQFIEKAGSKEWCPHCKHEWQSHEPTFRCPNCKGGVNETPSLPRVPPAKPGQPKPTGAKPGEVRQWKAGRFMKQPDGSWAPVPEGQESGKHFHQHSREEREEIIGKLPNHPQAKLLQEEHDHRTLEEAVHHDHHSVQSEEHHRLAANHEFEAGEVLGEPRQAHLWAASAHRLAGTLHGRASAGYGWGVHDADTMGDKAERATAEARRLSASTKAVRGEGSLLDALSRKLRTGQLRRLPEKSVGELTDALTFFQFVEKGKAAKPGESRNWGGQQYTKQPDGSWKPKESVARNVGAAWGQLGPLNPKAAGPRGKKINPADLHPTFMEHEMDFGKKGKHTVRLHYDVNPGERPDTQSPGYEPFVEDLKIVNRHGEDIGHHVPEAERKKLEGHVLQSWAGGLAEQGTAERQRSILDLKIPVEEITTGPSADAGTPESAAEEEAGTPASEFKSLESVINYKNFTEKGKAAQPGETRNWGGTDYTKQPDGTWKPKGAATHEQGVAFGPHSTSGPTPRGDKADTSGWDGSMKDTLDFNWGKGDANEHDVTVHYILHREEAADRNYPGAPAYAEVLVVNEHGEDVTDHIPEKHIRELEERAMQHVNR